MTDHSEAWRPVVRYEGFYEVSDWGRVRSLDRWVTDRIGRRRFYPGVMLSPTLRGPYLKVTLTRAGEQVTERVHVLVLEAFAGLRPPGQHARHGRGGQQDNRWPENLCWGTREDNMGPDRVRDGTDNRGERCATAKLTGVIVLECRRRRAEGEAVAVLAEAYGVSKWTMYDALSGRNWAHLSA